MSKMTSPLPSPALYVDADACPLKDEILKIARRHQRPVFLVTNSWLRNMTSDLIKVIVVSEGADKADDWIVDHIQSPDIFITADILLAERCIKKGALGLSPQGKLFTKESIGSAVSLRGFNTYLRESGDISGHNKPFSSKDRSAFLQNLENLLQRLK